MSRFVPLLTLLLLLLTPLAWAADDGQKDGSGQQTSSGAPAGEDKGKGKKASGGGAQEPEPECD